MRVSKTTSSRVRTAVHACQPRNIHSSRSYLDNSHLTRNSKLPVKNKFSLELAITQTPCLESFDGHNSQNNYEFSVLCVTAPVQKFHIHRIRRLYMRICYPSRLNVGISSIGLIRKLDFHFTQLAPVTLQQSDLYNGGMTECKHQNSKNADHCRVKPSLRSNFRE